jgi:hypothetical protein
MQLRKQSMTSNREEIVVRERQIEDILATYTDLLGQILGASAPLRVLARQLELPDGGRLDLICLGGGQLYLVEIKVEPARSEFVQQTARCLAQIPILQQQGELPAGSVQGYLLSPRIPPRLLSECQQYQIHAIEYVPSRVLQHFYMNFQQHLSFNRLTTHNHGVWHLGVTNPSYPDADNYSYAGYRRRCCPNEACSKHGQKLPDFAGAVRLGEERRNSLSPHGFGQAIRFSDDST